MKLAISLLFHNVSQWLKSLKTYLEELPCGQVSRELLDETEEIPSGFEDLEFGPPTNFQIAGSYLLRSVARPNLNIGVFSTEPTISSIRSSLHNLPRQSMQAIAGGRAPALG